MPLISPDWPLERKILRLRFLLALLFAFNQFTGLLRIDWTAFWLLMAGGCSLLAVIGLGTAKRWSFVPTFNFAADQVITLSLLSVSGAAAGPYVFLIYLHVLSATVFLRRVGLVILVGSIQVVVLFLSTLLLSLSAGEASWSAFLIHSLGLMMIASTLTEPARGLYRDAETDALTGTLNRRSGLRELRQWLGVKPRFNLIFADMKGFKQINDRYGHAVGDTVLRRIAQLILECVRDDDLVIRYGGDEFLIACQGEPEAVTERLVEALDQPILTAQGEVRAVVDLGVARYPENAQTLDDLIKFADEHMFERKRGAPRA